MSQPQLEKETAVTSGQVTFFFFFAFAMGMMRELLVGRTSCQIKDFQRRSSSDSHLLSVFCCRQVSFSCSVLKKELRNLVMGFVLPNIQSLTLPR